MMGLAAKAATSASAIGVVGVTVLASGLQAIAPGAASPTATATADIPVAYLRDYQTAAQLCPGLDWTVLAGVGKVESDHGRAPRLVSPTGAQGAMQFEPATWAHYGVDADGDGHADPFNPTDAISSAATYLCALHVTTNVHDALIAYTCGNTQSACQVAAAGYAATVLQWATRYGRAAATALAAAAAIHAALAQLGTPYVWGGTSSAGFDCSGLTQWSYAHAGVMLPRVAQDQYDATPAVPPGAPLRPGDLVFFGHGPHAIDHVGIYLGDGRMVDAPHTGATVRVEPITGFDPPYLGATRPWLVTS